MKKLTSLISILLSLLLAGCSSTSVNATEVSVHSIAVNDTAIFGDADCDGVVSIIDATKIQRHLVSLLTLDGTAQKLADVDNSSEVEITDATYIQRYLASISVPYPIGEPIEDNPAPTEEKTEWEYEETEMTFTRNNMKINGRLLLPEGDGPFPAVILGHGFGGNLSYNIDYARAFAGKGIAAYAFDFIGGGYGSRSDGKITDMSVLTEAADMSTVLDGIKALQQIDSNNIFLMGESQGGFVASYVAGTRPNDVRGLIAFYPAYVLQDDAWQRTPDPDNIPETMNLMDVTIGRIYNQDAMSFDIYDIIKNYSRNALIIHGTRDSIAPISYSERAVEVFPSAELIKIEGAGHGFYGEDDDYAAEQTIHFVKNNLV